jgi:WD40 repeat protein
VNAVKWLPNVVECSDPKLRWAQPEIELASASSDKNIIIWKMKPDQKWQAIALLQGHEDAVTGLTKLDLHDGTLFLASCSGDRTVRIWKRSSPKDGNQYFNRLLSSPSSPSSSSSSSSSSSYLN